MAHRDVPLVRPISEDPRIVGPFFAYVDQEADLARADSVPPAIVAHEEPDALRRLRSIVNRHGIPFQAAVEAFYVGRFSQMEASE